MFNEAALKIELHRGNKTSILDVQYDRALIGSGAHCDVRLAPDEAAIEQLLVEVMGEEVYVRARSLEPPCLLNGAPFFEGRLPPTSMLELGAIAIRIERVERKDTDGAAKRSSNSSTSPVVQALGLLVVGAGLYMVISKDTSTSSALDGSLTPPVAAQVAPESCPQSDPAGALALAEQSMVDGENKRERSPFYPADALTAVPLFERAARCFETAGKSARAKEAHEAAASLHARTQDEVHVSHVRLERFLAQSQFDEARHEAQFLSGLVEPHTPYAQWLSAVVRQGELKRSKKK